MQVFLSYFKKLDSSISKCSYTQFLKILIIELLIEHLCATNYNVPRPDKYKNLQFPNLMICFLWMNDKPDLHNLLGFDTYGNFIATFSGKNDLNSFFILQTKNELEK